MSKVVGGKYELGRLLGRGTTATVRLCVDLESKKEYAVKVLALDEVVKRNMEEQVKREIAILKTLRHRNVVTLKEVLQSRNNIYIVMELVNGGTLVDEIQKSPNRRFSEDKARRYFQQLVLGLRYVHNQEVAHRDLKPLNLLLDAQGTLKISDFGLSQMQTETGLMTTMCGTPHFVAPDILSKQPYNGMKADIWSCGIILYVMLTGSVPFDDPDLKLHVYEGLWSRIRSGNFEMPRWVSPEAQELLVRMIDVDPDRRCTLEYIIAHSWFREGFDRARLDDGYRVDSETGEPIKETHGSNAALNVQLNPHLLASSGGMLNAFELCDHLRSFIFNADNTQRVFYYRQSIQATLKELLDLCTRLKYNPKVMKDTYEMKCFTSMPRLMTFTINLESMAISERTLVEITLGSGQSPELALPNNPFDEMVRTIRGNLREEVSEEVEPSLADP
jgi:serine/threonine protein kinase